MKFNAVYALVGHLPCTEEKQCRILYDWILESRPAESLELGFLYGKTSCIIAAALDEIGSGHLTSIDIEGVRNHQDNPNILQNLEKAGLSAYVTPVFSGVSYTWEMKKIIERQTVAGVCQPIFNFVFLDGAHLWETDACAFFLAMKLLQPGGWILFDDYLWSIERSDWWHKAPEMQNKPADFRTEQHVERLITLLVAQHPEIESVVIKDNWVWARKKTAAGVAGGPRVMQLNKTIVKHWLVGKFFKR